VVPVIVALYMSYEPVKKLGSIHNTIKQGLASLKRLHDIKNADESIIDPPHPTPVKPVEGRIEFNKVSFQYPSLENTKEQATKALNCIDLTISAGEIIALVGPSGAGKTTFAALLNRLYDPCEGAILLDGTDLRQISLKDLREAVASVPQKPFLFDDTIEQNIELGKSCYTTDSIENALGHAYATEFVSAMEMQNKQNIGEKGSRISGGQLQRLALARAFYRNSPILLMDEATSALDSENEERIYQAMKMLTKGKTTIMIAHRFSSIRLANRILVMDKGEIIADGSHEELYQDCSLYRNLYDQQSSN